MDPLPLGVPYCKFGNTNFVRKINSLTLLKKFEIGRLNVNSPGYIPE